MRVALTMRESEKSKPDRRLSVAPMMECTDRHDRAFLRMISRETLLYSEMITAQAVIHGDRDYLLGFSESEQPVAVQLAGSDPAMLTEAARIAEGFGYDEINLNVGCPSDRVQSGRFGACLMRDAALVGECTAAMIDAVAIPVTVKCRIGVDDQDGDASLDDFVRNVAQAGVSCFIIHARKAWLEGLSPKQNRDIPPLDYERVYRLKSDFPALEIIINGGIETLSEARRHLAQIDGVMIGRAAYQNPYLLAEADRLIFERAAPVPSRMEIVDRLVAYADRACAEGVPLPAITRHVLGLFQGLPGARAWRRHLTEAARLPGAAGEVIAEAARLVSAAQAQMAQPGTPQRGAMQTVLGAR